MKILLCAATSTEILPTIEYLKQAAVADVSVLITGVGLTAATYSITRDSLRLEPDLLVQAGIAGSLDRSLINGQTVLVRSECLGDLGVIAKEGFQSLSDMGLTGADDFPWNRGKLWHPNHSSLNELNIAWVDAVSVQEITTDATRITYYREVLGAQIESMEGAALHYVGIMEKKPFFQLRAISNDAGERNKKKWRMKEAIAGLNETLQQLLIKLNSK